MNRRLLNSAAVLTLFVLAVSILLAAPQSSNVGNPVRLAAQEPDVTYSVLYTFTGGADGGRPNNGLIADTAGNLYGTTSAGGDSGQGVVFKLDPSGTETVLYAFTGGADGSQPNAGLVSDPAGNLYGTTVYGGNVSCSGGFGCGVVFKVDPSGTETVLYTFTGGSDGAVPEAGLLRDPGGNLYGTTYFGGSRGAGVVFEVNAAGQFRVLLTFNGRAGGYEPYADLVRDSAGNLYGTTLGGGNDSSSCPFRFDYGCGVVFKLDPKGNETVLYAFPGGADGALPEAGLVRDAAGNLYGTTVYGGNTSGPCSPYGGCGVVFKLNPSGTETVLYTFSGGADGYLPLSTLVQDSAGDLYGTTFYGGSGSGLYGVVFKLDPSGKYTELHSFTGSADGCNPLYGQLLLHRGSLYGTTSSQLCGYSEGTIFKIN